MASHERIIFERILCPIDLTPESGESLRYGIALAKAYDSKLFVINCVDSYAVSGPRARTHIRQLLDTAVRKHLLDEFNIEIGAGLGPLAGKIWRVGLMGASSSPRLIVLLRGALESALAKQGRHANV